MNALKKIFTWSFPKADKPLPNFTRKEGVYYLIGMLGQNIIYSIIGAALSVFYSDVLMIEVGITGIIITIGRVWDAANDPVMGMVMDRTKSKWGKCRPFLKYIPIPIAIVVACMFLPISGAAMWFKVAYCLFIYLLFSVVYTMGDIPLWSLPSLMVPDEAGRTKVLSAARIVGSLGAVVTALFAPLKNLLGAVDLGWFANTGRPNYEGYFSQEQGYFLAVLVLVMFGGILFKFIFPNVRERVDTSHDEIRTFKQNLEIIKKNKPFIRIVISGILGSTKTILLTAGLYFAKWVLGNGNEGSWVIFLGGAYLGGSLISMAICPAVAKKFTKRKLYLWTSYLSAVPYVALYFIGFKSSAVMFIGLLLGGFFSGFSIMLQTAMTADTVDHIEYTQGIRAHGVFFSGVTFVAKLTSGIAILVSSVLLAVVDYTDTIKVLTQEIEAATNAGTTYALNFAATYPDITQMMFFLITIVPALGCVLQAIPMHKYELDDDYVERISVELEEKRAAAKAAEAQTDVALQAEAVGEPTDGAEQ